MIGCDSLVCMYVYAVYVYTWRITNDKLEIRVFFYSSSLYIWHYFRFKSDAYYSLLNGRLKFHGSQWYTHTFHVNALTFLMPCPQPCYTELFSILYLTYNYFMLRKIWNCEIDTLWSIPAMYYLKWQKLLEHTLQHPLAVKLPQMKQTDTSTRYWVWICFIFNNSGGFNSKFVEFNIFYNIFIGIKLIMLYWWRNHSPMRQN